VPKQFDVSSLIFVTFGLNSRQFDVKLKGKFAGNDVPQTMELEDSGETDDLNVIRHILAQLPAAYGNNTPVAFTLTLDDDGKIVVPPVTQAPAPGEVSININTADATKLQTLWGIGPATANRIIAKRPFNTLDDLEKVEGIGPAKMQDIKPHITV